MDHSDSEDSEKSDSSDSEYLSDEEHKPKSSAQEDKDKMERKRSKASTDGENKEGAVATGDKATPEPPLKEKQGSNGPDRDLKDKPRTPQSQPLADKPKAPEDVKAAANTSAAEQDSDSERELVIDLGDEHGGRDSKRAKRELGSSTAKAAKESNVAKLEGEACFCFFGGGVIQDISVRYGELHKLRHDVKDHENLQIKLCSVSLLGGRL